MSRCRSCALLLWLALTVVVRAEQPLADSTIVVYNAAAPDSLDLARFYAQQRGIARDHLVALNCSDAEEIDRREYDENIAAPLRDAFQKRGWWTMHDRADGTKSIDRTYVRFVAVMKGVPLKIRPVATPYPGDEPRGGPIDDKNEASVDSELSILGLYARQISGIVTNPFFKSFVPIREFENPVLLLVCRLDAPTAAVVRRMITDSIAAEKNGLLGRAYIDASHNSAPGAAIGDEWMRTITNDLRKVGVPTVLDDLPGVFPAGYPMTSCALYYGWYADHAAGPFSDSKFRFVPGGIGVHIHSFSAGTLRDPNAGWIAPLLLRGAAASLGNVYEPYLQFSANLALFDDHLLHGFTFAESAYAAQPVLSWMSVAVGDPLYRPYRSWLPLDNTPRSPNDWRTYHEFAKKNLGKPAAEYRSLARQTAARTRNAPMLEDLAGIAVNDVDLAGAISLFDQARATYKNRDDIVRVVIQECDALVKSDQRKRALALARVTLRIVSEAPSAPILQEIERQLSAPAP